MKLVSSNKFKLKEFKRFGLDIDIQEGLDLKEVAGNSKEVVIYKSIEAGENLIVEDTILTINGKEIVDIREKINSLNQFEGQDALWTVSIACVLDKNILFSSATIKGIIKEPKTDITKAFGFDPFFYPDNSNLSLHSLEMQNLKDNFSARKLAIEYFINRSGNFEIISLNSIKPWNGKYQNITK
jgi:inosine/xanthosine triphosphate pyrophosphatase family protein